MVQNIRKLFHCSKEFSFPFFVSIIFFKIHNSKLGHVDIPRKRQNHSNIFEIVKEK